MSENDTMTEVVVEEATEQLDVQGLVDGESLQEQVDSARVGRAVGARLGEGAGRQLGAAVGRRVHETFTDVDRETNPRELGRDLSAAVTGGVSDAISTSRERGSALATVVDSMQDAGLGSALADALGVEDVEPEAQEQESESETDEPASGSEAEETDSQEETESGEAEETESEGDETDSDGESAEDAVDEIDAEDVDVGDLESFQTETLREYLDTISYRDLQSIAKDLDVKANLSSDEMADRIVETVSDDGDES